MDELNAPIAHLGLLDDEDIQLDLAALELSALDHPGIDLAPYHAVLDDMEEQLALLGGGAITATEQVAALSQVVAGHFGFAGDRDSYDAPLNADMIRVIDRRRGLPVSLAILYVAAARRLGWSAHALNTPGHVVFAIGARDEERLFCDPFAGGQPMAGDRLGMLLGLASADALAVALRRAAMTNRMTLARLLINQAVRAEQGGDLPRAAAMYERMTIVAPGDAKAWWELARLQLVGHDRAAARASLSAMLEVTRDPEQRRSALAILDTLG